MIRYVRRFMENEHYPSKVAYCPFQRVSQLAFVLIFILYIFTIQNKMKSEQVDGTVYGSVKLTQNTSVEPKTKQRS